MPRLSVLLLRRRCAQPLPRQPMPAPVLPPVLTDPAMADQLGRVAGALTRSLMNLPVGELEAAIEGRPATRADRARTVRDSIGDPYVEQRIEQPGRRVGPDDPGREPGAGRLAARDPAGDRRRHAPTSSAPSATCPTRPIRAVNFSAARHGLTRGRR